MFAAVSVSHRVCWKDIAEKCPGFWESSERGRIAVIAGNLKTKIRRVVVGVGKQNLRDPMRRRIVTG